ncbi:MAG: anthranilate synthase component I family protein [Phycisphaerae bacterium]|nr:anthranilate synthase component I family protein [Phycisphaerae bacterium]
MSRWEIVETAYSADATDAVRSWSAGEELAWLDSPIREGQGDTQGRFSIVGNRPGVVIEQYEGQSATLTVNGVETRRHADGWRLWRQTHERLPKLPRLPHDLSPGWIGYVGFEMARLLERLPATRSEDLSLPVMRLALFDQGIVLDHEHQRAWAVAAPAVRAALGLPPGTPAMTLAREWDEVLRRPPVRPAVTIDCAPCHEMPRSHYDAMLRRALDYIAAGDIYQVNLCQRLRLSGLGDPLDVFAAMCRHNPAPYAALLRWGTRAVLSASPELFLRIDGDRALTCPIKGTRPRTGDVLLDAAYRAALMASEKERAELTMIVDLHRNDLGRVCLPGTVRVAEPRRLESHPSVYHTVADVVGRLRPECGPLDALMACFPAGSVSGVPKIRAIEIIDELEPVARGVYTGAIGALGLDGQMTFNVAIRTIQMHAGVGTLYVGGGIVADSEPADEYEETLAKARGILDALRSAASTVRMGHDGG